MTSRYKCTVGAKMKFVRMLISIVVIHFFSVALACNGVGPTNWARAEATAQVSPSFFGMSDYIHRPQLSNWEPWPSVPFANLRSLDTYTEWWKLEPSRGIYDWSNLDWLVGLAERHNVDLLYTFAMTPRWASSD